MVIRESFGDRLFNVINIVLLILITIPILYPLYFILIASISDPSLVSTGQVLLLPKGITLQGYERVFRDGSILLGYRNSLFYAVVGTVINLFFTITGAYALAKPRLRGRTVFSLLFVFTMYFSGGLIPTYLVVHGLKLTNTMWAMVVPNAVAVMNLIICRTFFQNSIPAELEESATIDGCSHFRTLISIVLPLSKAILSVLTLYYALSHWNSYFDALIYLRNKELYSLQLIIRQILVLEEMNKEMMEVMADGDDLANNQARIAMMIKYSVIIVASVPMLILYPLVQKHFTKGVMLGALKG